MYKIKATLAYKSGQNDMESKHELPSGCLQLNQTRYNYNNFGPQSLKLVDRTHQKLADVIAGWSKQTDPSWRLWTLSTMRTEDYVVKDVNMLLIYTAIDLQHKQRFCEWRH